MKILLIDIKPNKQSEFVQMVALALRKLYNHYKANGDEVEFIFAGKTPKQVPDVICFSVIFLFNLHFEIGYIRAYQQRYPKAKIRVGGISVSLRPEIFREKLGDDVEIMVGIDEGFDRVAPNYEMAPSKFSYGFTSRGCINKCGWCVVPKIEGKLRVIDGWRNQLGPHNLFLSMDNNLLACGEEHLVSVMQTMRERKMKIDFNQGLDCVVFAKGKEFHKIMKDFKANIDNMRFSWDGKRQNKYVEMAVNALDQIGIRATWYMLYGFDDTIEEVHERLYFLLSRKQNVKLMRYRDLETGAYNADVEGWHTKLSSLVGRHFITGVLGGGRWDTRELVPKDVGEFKRTLLLFDSYSGHDKMIRRDDVVNIVKMRNGIEI